MTEKNSVLPTSALMAACGQIAQTAEQDGKAPVCFAVVDPSGTLRCLYRMDTAPARLVAIAISKAYTAARMETSTLAFKTRLDREKLTLGDFCDPGLTSLPGGIPLKTNEEFLGAVGISGRSLEDDHALAESLAHRLKSLLKSSEGDCAVASRHTLA